MGFAAKSSGQRPETGRSSGDFERVLRRRFTAAERSGYGITTSRLNEQVTRSLFGIDRRRNRERKTSER